jgi:hypothetical protein
LEQQRSVTGGKLPLRAEGTGRWRAEPLGRLAERLPYFEGIGCVEFSVSENRVLAYVTKQNIRRSKTFFLSGQSIQRDERQILPRRSLGCL